MSFANIAKDELICPICYELLKAPNIPKDLPNCQHVCCEVCLHKVQKEVLEDGVLTIKCPECRKENRVPDGGISEYKTNLRLKKLAEKQSDYTQVKLKLECTPIVNTDECPRHKSENMLFYCLSCKKPICQRCLVPNHLKHDVKEQDEVINQQKERIEELVKAAELKEKLCQETLDKLDQMEDDFNGSVRTEREKIRKYVSHCVLSIREKGRHLRENLKICESQQPYLDIIKDDKKILQNKLDTLNAIHASAEQLEIIENYTAVMKLDELRGDQEVCSLSINTPCVPHFICYLSPFTNIILGKIVVYSVDMVEGPGSITEAEADGKEHFKIRKREKCDIEDLEPIAKSGPVDVIVKADYRTHQTNPQAHILSENRAECESLQKERDVHYGADSFVSQNLADTVKVLSNDEPNVTSNTQAIVRPAQDIQRPSSKLVLKLVYEFGHFLNATCIACGTDIVAVCDSERNQVTVYEKEGKQFKGVFNLSSSQPRDVAVMTDNTILVANSQDVEMYPASSRYNRKRTINTSEKGGSLREIRKDIVSIVTNPGFGFLVGDTARCVITRHSSSGVLLGTINVTVKPYHMAVINGNRIAVSDSEYGEVLIKDIAGDSTILRIDKTHGLCFVPNSDGSSLLISKIDKSKNDYRPEKRGIIEQCNIKEQRAIKSGASGKGNRSIRPYVVGCLAEDLRQPGGMAFLSEFELAVADGRTVKIYQVVHSIQKAMI